MRCLLVLLVFLLVTTVTLAKKKNDEVAVASTQSWYEAATQLVATPWNYMIAFMVSLPELLQNFDQLFTKLQQLAQSTIESWFHMFQSTARKTEQAQARYTAIDTTVKELTRLRQSIEAACMYPKDETARSLCVDRAMEVTSKLQTARRKRQVWQDRLERLQRK